MSNKSFIVPHDFSEVADNALSHAITTAKVVDAKIYLLHVISKNKDIKEAEAKLKEIVEANKQQNIEIIPKVRLGTIFEDIGDFAAEHHAELIFMGTHGAAGWQHIAGSYALKVITNSSVPFVIVQKETQIGSNGYDNIVVPLDLHRETKQKLAIVASMAKYFKSRVHVVTPNETDEFLKNKVDANVLFAKRFFEEREIEMTVTVAPSNGFDKEVVKIAIEKDADLISIMNLNKNNLFSSAFNTNYEQYMITNDAKIPVLVVNPMDTPYGASILFK
ncbi:MAG TPA: universal stress protein [Brumimicrobium sp.]|nr:universal stress protein [Brumimicrobium sp.]